MSQFTAFYDKCVENNINSFEKRSDIERAKLLAKEYSLPYDVALSFRIGKYEKNRDSLRAAAEKSKRTWRTRRKAKKRI